MLPRPATCHRLRLFGFSDYAASDARRRAGSRTFGSMNHQSGAAIAKDGVFCATHGHVGGDDGNVRGMVVGDDEEEIRNIAGRHALVAVTRGVEVRTGAFEIGGIALSDLVNVHGMLARWEILDIELDAHAFRNAGERGGANTLALGISDVDDCGFCEGMVMRILRRSGNAETKRQKGEA